jgi:4-hydroxybenzoate polyprenyltransferase
LRPYLVLIRPANVLTSIGDVLAGLAIVTVFDAVSFDALLLVLATACLYAGGIVFNDYFDRDLDRIERPERPIPSGKVSPKAAVTFGVILFLIAVISSFMVGKIPGILAVSIMVFALLYDRWMKHTAFGGPLFMGLARAANLLLGISYSLRALNEYYWIGVIPLIFIASITLTSQEENRGENRQSILLAIVLDLAVIFVLLYMAFTISGEPWWALVLVTAWAFMVINAKWKAYKTNTSENIKKAVKTGVISLILLDASYAAMVPEFGFMVLILSLLPLSLLLGRKFAVT